MRRNLSFIAAIIALLSASAAVAEDALPRGQVIASVVSLEDASQSYALYLPKAYTPQRKWPILYAFDPEALGGQPVEMARELAEKYGYIVAGSNVSRNGPYSVSQDAAAAMWKDTHRRLSIDEHRVYATGFSGGARVATTVALSCHTCIRAVVLHGAGFPFGSKPSKDVQFAIFASAGDLDFNYPEILQLDLQLEKLGIERRIETFAGPHQWAPHKIWEQAFAWLELNAMHAGLRPRDGRLIQSQMEEARSAAAAKLTAHDDLGAYRVLSYAALELRGLTDVADLESQAADLKNRSGFKNALKQERADAEFHFDLANDTLAYQEEMLQDPGQRYEDYVALRTRLAGIKRRVAEAKDDSAPPVMVLRRALIQAFVTLSEGGRQAMESHDYVTAAYFYDLITEFARSAPGAFYQRARLYMISNERKKALSALQKAVAQGLNDAALLRSTAEFQALQQEPDFQLLLNSLAVKSDEENRPH